MKGWIAAALLVAAFESAPAADDPERAQVMTALLHELAGDQRVPHRRDAGRSICVDRELSPAPLAGTRQPPPTDPKFDAPIGQPRRPWRPDTEEEARDRLWWVDPELAEAEKTEARRIQNAALTASLRDPAPAGVRRLVDPRWLAPNQSLDAGECVETQRFSEPDIALDHAFVYVSLDCGGLCGLHALYELRRDGDGWKIVNGRIDLIS